MTSKTDSKTETIEKRTKKLNAKAAELARRAINCAATTILLLQGCVSEGRAGECSPAKIQDAMQGILDAKQRVLSASKNDVAAYLREVETLVQAIELAQRCGPKQP